MIVVVASRRASKVDIEACLPLHVGLQGKEDLRTDERLVQFLRAAGAALKGGTGADGLEVHSFGVTPVARRAGLVQVRNQLGSICICLWQPGESGGAGSVQAVQCCE